MDGHSARDERDIAALAKGGRTNITGFVLRLAARLPFLFIAGRMYGPELLGRFAYAILIVEFAAQLATMGLRRGLAEQLSEIEDGHSALVYDGILLAVLVSLVAGAALIAVPQIMYPNSEIRGLDRMLPLVIPAIAVTEITLAALAYRYDIKATVRARAIVEPWTVSIAAFPLYYIFPRDGLVISYVISMVAALITALIPFFRSYGVPKNWTPRFAGLLEMSRRNFPLAAADGVEWGSRRLDLAILGLFASPAVVGIYYVAQQVASLPQKLKTSFDPILGPVITRNLKDDRKGAIAAQVSQVGFWIIAAQMAVSLALGLPGEAVMGVIGPEFVGGTGALAFLLMAEVAAAPAVVSEATLVYIARHRNLVISLSVLAFQAALSVGLLLLARHLEFPPLYVGAMPALALMISLGLMSALKSRLLARLLAAPIGVWRWALVWAAAATVPTFYVFSLLPEWTELVLGIPATMAVYGVIIWKLGFGDDDRALFRKAGGRDARESEEEKALRKSQN
ncbi:oligosaccharide flippase family protein [Novosphingopyxis sp. YJ-S2-01]|uniref:oligosaccharide flippase family protein n=1 Tax=Novosphingopyxis sp. YJ-S2-01 TaxID=2794021 RepID=UPI0018DD35CE|nr:oligosaccharide flippase family protein [Novosphingopyxis sp. YJ-S2-01]